MSGLWSGSMCRVHIAFQELQGTTLMLHRLASQLSGKIVALQLDNSTAKAYLSNQGSIVLFFLSRLACHILILANKLGITSIPAYIPTHLNEEANCVSQGRLAPEWYLLPHIAQAAFQGWICWFPHVPINVNFRTLFWEFLGWMHSIHGSFRRIMYFPLQH